jgi:hypothetical protein
MVRHSGLFWSNRLGGKLKRIVVTLVGLLLLTGCSTKTGDEATVDSDYPSEWSSTEIEIFELFTGFYPASALMDLDGKRALMDNSQLICDAYGEGYSRQEIQSATSGGAFTAEMADDWMTLSVTYLCPEFFDLQMSN